ncbi:MAG TPA: M20/M25/M40 family metallo-hydrolase [Thermoanaerobaculia bacterium]|jgi:acetylornithine deacetylase/succinyl-diaminopimelate desuccinylase-like protein|nr:M20/M25/M40 family metallo-hydrolase [Thermoanaerobaculia bacterium]
MTLILLALFLFAAVPPLDNPTRQLVRDIYRQLIEINTTESVGNMTTAAEAMAVRLRAAGFPESDVKMLAPEPRHGNLVARLRGTGAKKPILLLAHLDVVEARREDWSTDPFKLVEQDGWFYGRGTGDDKAMAAIWIATLIRLKQEHFVPNRDIIVALTADEETGDYNGVSWLVDNHRNLIDAALAINEGGGGAIKEGKYLYNGVGASEKVYVTLALTVRNKGGHSSVPQKPNAIYQLAAGLTRLVDYEFPVKLNEVTRAYFRRLADIEGGALAADMRALADHEDPSAAARVAQTPAYNARMRTTCVATRLDAGHADNALPQMAKATVNCRVLPGEDPEEVRKTVVRVLNDPAIEVVWIDKAKPSVPSPLSPEIMKPVEQLTSEFWPGVPVLPLMASGASDSLYVRNAGIPTYGISAMFGDINENRAHGKDERVGVKQFYDSAQFLYALVKRLSS